MEKSFADSQEFVFRRLVREAIRKAPNDCLTKSDRAVALALVNIWFHHKSGPKGYIHPGRKLLARKAKVTVKTVSRCLEKLRSAGVLEVLSNPRGGYKNATRYLVHPAALLSMCGVSLPRMFPGELFEVRTGRKCPTRMSENVPQGAGQNVPLSYRRGRAS